MRALHFLSGPAAAAPRNLALGAALALGLLLPSAAGAKLADAISAYDGSSSAGLPAKLSQTGLYKDFAARPRQVADGIFAYEVNAALWSDGAHKERFVSVPAGAKITPTDSDRYAFPDKTVLIKNFAVDTIYGNASSSIYVETRFMVFRKDAQGKGGWHGITYRWRRDQTDADLVDVTTGADIVINVQQGAKLRGKRWRYPSGADCAQCHTGRGFLGFFTQQLNRPAAGKPSINQLQDLVDKGVLASNPVAGKANSFRWVGPAEAGATLEQRARSYFGANCSHCHGNGQFMSAATHKFDYYRADQRYLYDNDHAGYVGKPGADYPYLIQAGRPDQSSILGKMTTRDASMPFNTVQMPPMATAQIDSAGLDIIRKWACQLGGKDTSVTTCKLPQTQGDNTFWTDPVGAGIAFHGAPAAYAEAARIEAGRLWLGTSAETGSPVSLRDVRGRAIRLARIAAGEYRILESLTPGTYLLRAGALSRTLAYWP